MGYRLNFFEKSFLRNTLLQVLSTYTAAITLSVANTCTVASIYVVASTYNVASTYEVAPRTFIPLQELALLGYCKYFRCCKYIGKTSKRKKTFQFGQFGGGYLKVPKSTTKYPKEPQSTQKYLRVPKSTSKCPKVPQCT